MDWGILILEISTSEERVSEGKWLWEPNSGKSLGFAALLWAGASQLQHECQLKVSTLCSFGAPTRHCPQGSLPLPGDVNGLRWIQVSHL